MRQIGQTHTTASSWLRSASTALVLHLKRLGVGNAVSLESKAWAITSTWTCAMARAGPSIGPIAPDLSRKRVRSVTYIGCRGDYGFSHGRRGATSIDFAWVGTPSDCSIADRQARNPDPWPGGRQAAWPVAGATTLTPNAPFLSPRPPADAFELLQQIALIDRTFVRLVLGKPRAGAADLVRLSARPASLAVVNLGSRTRNGSVAGLVNPGPQFFEQPCTTRPASPS